MIKNYIKKRIIISFLSIFIISLIYLIPKNKNINESIIYNNNTNYVYLLKSKKLIRTKLVSNQTNTIEKAKETIEALTINSKYKNYINNNYIALIPPLTKVIDISLTDTLLKINFSKDLLSVSLENEELLIESLIYSLTEIDGINKIMIFVEGEILNRLPNSNKALPTILDRNYGINKIYNIYDINNVSKLTLYYYSKVNENYEVVPVTLYTNTDENKVEVIIKELKSTITYQSDLVSFLSNKANLLNFEMKENNIKLFFSGPLLDSFYEDTLLEEVKYAMSESIKETLNIDVVEIYIDNIKI